MVVEVPGRTQMQALACKGDPEMHPPHPGRISILAELRISDSERKALASTCRTNNPQHGPDHPRLWTAHRLKVVGSIW
jgi:hypothetical protein